MASISSTGLVTGVSGGTVYAKAAAVQDITVTDSLMITITSGVGIYEKEPLNKPYKPPLDVSPQPTVHQPIPSQSRLS